VSKEEPGSKRVKEGGPEGGECQKEERKRFEKKDDFNEKSISKRVYWIMSKIRKTEENQTSSILD